MTGWPLEQKLEFYTFRNFADWKTIPLKKRWVRRPALVYSAIALGIAASLATVEMRRSPLQASVFAAWSRTMTYEVARGPSPAIRFPSYGPYDQRLGYTQIRNYVARLTRQGYVVARQARPSAGMVLFQKLGGFPPYDEKATAGLRLRDARGQSFYAAAHPSTSYSDFASVPKAVVDALLFIENRELLDFDSPKRNPAVEWDRLALAVLQHGSGGLFGGAGPGGSTLATQLEKLRHSPEGRTADPGEKLRQMLSASVRAYHGGPDTRRERERIIVGVLNSTPLAGVDGHGEVIGLKDGLAVWFGADFADTNQALRRVESGRTKVTPEAALALKQVLSLLIAQRRPSYYLRAGRADLNTLTDSYLRLMSDRGALDRGLSDAAIATRLRFAERKSAWPMPMAAPASAKAINATRFELLRQLGVPSLHDLDRLDLTAETTLDVAVQARVTEHLRRLREPGALAAMGLTGYRMLGRGDPTKVAYSFTLFERGANANYPRIQTDSLDQPLDLNVGTKLELGSTAKVRTLLTYLEIVADLYDAYRVRQPIELAEIAATGDALRSFVASHLLVSGDPGLTGMMQAAMQKRYSAGTGERFFTAGGRHRFANFSRRHGGQMPVDKALQQSVNLVFIRMMRDIVDYHIGTINQERGDVIADVNHPLRMAYLRRFADLEGRQYLQRFYRDYRGLPPDAILQRIAARAKFLRPRLAAAYRTILPGLTYEGFATLINEYALRKPADEEAMRDLYDMYSPARLNLADRSYVSSIHPLELWLAGHLHDHPHSTWDEIVAASADVRQESYSWLFKRKKIAGQNRRIRTLLEQEAFTSIEAQWRKLGYPFEHLVPSYATAIGTSGDRPDALAELMGIIVNDGVRLPTVRVGRLHFAKDTPYETIVEAAPAVPERVVRPEIARVLRDTLIGTVETGTARRASGVFQAPDGAELAIGGKTGTGDNRTDHYGRRGRFIGSEVRSRTATFVFFIGERWYGTITAHVAGQDAAKYRFTSALPVQLFRSLAPALEPLVEKGGVVDRTRPATEAEQTPYPAPA